jgi:hypothetical protein
MAYIKTCPLVFWLADESGKKFTKHICGLTTKKCLECDQHICPTDNAFNHSMWCQLGILSEKPLYDQSVKSLLKYNLYLQTLVCKYCDLYVLNPHKTIYVGQLDSNGKKNLHWLCHKKCNSIRKAKKRMPYI